MYEFAITIESGAVVENYRVEANTQLTAEVKAMRKFFSEVSEQTAENAIVTSAKRMGDVSASNISSANKTRDMAIRRR